MKNDAQSAIVQHLGCFHHFHKLIPEVTLRPIKKVQDQGHDLVISKICVKHVLLLVPHNHTIFWDYNTRKEHIQVSYSLLRFYRTLFDSLYVLLIVLFGIMPYRPYPFHLGPRRSMQTMIDPLTGSLTDLFINNCHAVLPVSCLQFDLSSVRPLLTARMRTSRVASQPAAKRNSSFLKAIKIYF